MYDLVGIRTITICRTFHVNDFLKSIPFLQMIDHIIHRRIFIIDLDIAIPCIIIGWIAQYFKLYAVSCILQLFL